MHEIHHNTAATPVAEPEADRDTTIAMGGLLADMNHEIRTAMNDVVGMLDLLAGTALTDAQLRYLRKAQSGTNALLKLTGRIADLSLIETGRFRLASAPFDLRREVEAAIAGKAEEAQVKGLHFSAALSIPAMTDMTVIHVDGDHARVHALLSCMIETMICAARQGTVSVDLTATCDLPGKCRIACEIKAGPIAKADRQLIAAMGRPGEQDKALLRTHGRKAVEPVLAARLASFLGERIEAATDQSDVTTLRCSFVLPVAPPPLSHVRAMLIAEDAAEWQAFLAPVTTRGLQIDALGSPMEGLVALKRSASEDAPYRIVMLGTRVQGMDATILASAIKGDALGRDAALVLLSESETEDEAGLARAGFSALIGKSAAPESLLRLLERVRDDAALGNGTGFVSTAAKAHAATPSSGRRILIADDNPINLEVAARMLEKLGFECVLATNGREAVDMHRARPCDLVLMDCEMPDVDGFQATAIIRSLEAASGRTPVIALTASTSQGEREKCLASGMDDFLSKPIRPQVLSEILARWLPADATASTPTDAGTSVPLKDELDAIQAMFGADFAELAQLYQRDAPSRIASLRRAYGDGDYLQVAKVAHALGGSSASIGATGLSGLCRTIETRVKAGELDGFEHTMAILEDEYRRICSKLQALTD